MHRARLSLAVLVGAALATAGCDAGTKESQNRSPGPQLFITSPRPDQVLTTDDVSVKFDLRDYVLSPAKRGADGAYEKGSGQHVHLIVDDRPYEAIYDVSKAVPLKKEWMTPGTHLVRAFPSAGPADAKGAAWHESRKNSGAFVMVRFHVKERGGPIADLDLGKPLLTYSRPKGTYDEGDADAPLLFPLLVDFYLTNVALSEHGYGVRVAAGGKTVLLHEWKPARLEGIAPGEVEVSVALVDRDGNVVDAPFNPTTRKITVKGK